MFSIKSDAAPVQCTKYFSKQVAYRVERITSGTRSRQFTKLILKKYKIHRNN